MTHRLSPCLTTGVAAALCSLPRLAGAHPGGHDHGGFANDLLHVLPGLDDPLLLIAAVAVLIGGMVLWLYARRRG